MYVMTKREETWKLAYGTTPTGRVEVPCQGIEDAKAILERTEKMMGYSAFWAEVVHTVTTVESTSLEVGQDSSVKPA
jgi:hypothetical protein